jgi:hypothetical protein
MAKRLTKMTKMKKMTTKTKRTTKDFEGVVQTLGLRAPSALTTQSTSIRQRTLDCQSKKIVD